MMSRGEKLCKVLVLYFLVKVGERNIVTWPTSSSRVTRVACLLVLLQRLADLRRRAR